MLGAGPRAAPLTRDNLEELARAFPDVSGETDEGIS